MITQKIAIKIFSKINRLEKSQNMRMCIVVVLLFPLCIEITNLEQVAEARWHFRLLKNNNG